MSKEETKKEIGMDDLARILQDGLLRMDNGFKEVRSDIEAVKNDVAVLKIDLKKVKSTVENIEADLNKKVDKIDHNTLTYRVEKLEKKFV